VLYGSSVGLPTRAAACIAALVFALTLPLAAPAGVIPLPAETVAGVGAFNVGPGTIVRVPSGDRAADAAAHYLVALWTRTNHLTVPIALETATATGTDTIAFRHQSGFAPEAYGLEITPQGVTVAASSAAGLFYGAITLWQLLPPGSDRGQIPAQTIRDAPKYAWRGLMLDSARHFQSTGFIRSMIDWMAWHKLNVLHWHLTDDQGWRLQIRRYPRLTSIGAWRIEPNGTRYGGFYTQEEVRDIVRFAATRHVQIVPEIEMPGHATAAIAAYPSLGTAGRSTPLSVSASWGVFAHLFNLEPRTFKFLEHVLDEVRVLFPSSYIHIGGDEAAKDEWNASPEVQARARELGIHGSDALQDYFTQRIARYLAAHGRRAIGWDEILRPGMGKDAIVMSWHGVTGARAAALAGNDTILAPAPTLYFDNRQSTLPTEPPGRLTVVSLEDVYRFDPRDDALQGTAARHVLGIQANLWTEHIQTEERLQWMALPRAAAAAEVGWSSAESRNWPDFLQRLVPMFARYAAFGIHYADSVFAPAAQISRRGEQFSVALSNQAQHDAPALGDIRYTLDGGEPSAASRLYDSTLSLPLGTEIRAAAFVGSTQASHTWVRRLDAQFGLRRNSHDLEICSDGIGLLLQPNATGNPLAVDIMNPCWIDRGVDLSDGPRVLAAVVALPFNFELGADAANVKIGAARSPQGELEIHVDGCDTPVVGMLPLAGAATDGTSASLPALRLPRIPGRHDLCLRFARPRLHPMWALDWVEIGE
jgi:hexosaminidase